jgi:RNA polymerase sigma-70 factor, ECF subfamily
MAPDDLQEISLRIRNGDQAAFNTLVTMLQQTAFRLSFRILCNEEEAREAVQVSFIRIWEKIGTYDPGKRFSTWAFRIFANTAIDRFRAIRRHPMVGMDKLERTVMNAGSSDPETDLGNKEISHLIRLIADGLPEKQRLVFILKDIEGRGSEEVSQILDMSEESVKSNLWHARKTVRKRLSALISYERIRQ